MFEFRAGVLHHRGGNIRSTIDYFLVSETLADAVSEINYFHLAPPRPHRPTYLGSSTHPSNIQVVVLKEPKKLPIDPPFGPLVPPQSWGPMEEVTGPLDAISNEGNEEFYGTFSVGSKEDAEKLLTSSLSSWLSRAEDDLLFILGSRASKGGRGEISATIKVNLINTFKSPAGEVSVVAKALRWVQMRFRELQCALEAWATAVHYPHTTAAYRRVRGLIDATLSHGLVRSPFSKYKMECRKTWNPRLKSVCEQIAELMRITGFRRPHDVIVRSIVARCAMFAAKATIDADAQEKADNRQQLAHR